MVGLMDGSLKIQFMGFARIFPAKPFDNGRVLNVRASLMVVTCIRPANSLLPDSELV
jgi:hypothetical protein